MKAFLQQLTGGKDLTTEEAEQLLYAMIAKDQEPALSGAVLATLRAKGESPNELRGFALAMRKLAINPGIPEDTRTIDIVGTGGDGSGSLNLSTGAALLTAACGTPVVKHGNRSVTSQSGSADVLEALGIHLPAPKDAARLLQRSGFTFLFAPYFHPAMRTVGPIRKALGITTVFNIVGPLTNPAAPPFYVIGAFCSSVAQLMADAISGLPIERAFVVHGAEGWDEATPIGRFRLWDVRPGCVRQSVRDPADLHLPRCTTTQLAGGSAKKNASAIQAVFDGQHGPHRDALTLGAGLALEVTGSSKTLTDGINRAREAIDDGSAKALLSQLSGLESLTAASPAGV